MARNIVFLGIKHCGKSTHGKLLAARLKREFFDTDDLLVAYYRKKYSPDTEDISPRWIMRQHGEEFFRRTEAETVLEFLQNNPAGVSVLALGGGVPERFEGDPAPSREHIFALDRWTPDWDAPPGEQSIQAVLWELRKEQIRRVRHFTAK